MSGIRVKVLTFHVLVHPAVADPSSEPGLDSPKSVLFKAEIFPVVLAAPLTTFPNIS